MDADGATSFHFRMEKKFGAGEAVAHQAYIEEDKKGRGRDPSVERARERMGEAREAALEAVGELALDPEDGRLPSRTAVVAGFGNISDRREDRMRLWRAIGDGKRIRNRKGSIRLGRGAAPELKRAVVAGLRRMEEECGHTSSLTDGAIADLERTARTRGTAGLAEREMEMWTETSREHWAVVKWIQSKAKALGIELPKDEEGEERGLPDGMRAYEPRQGIVQRELQMELAHELDVETMKRVLRTWCEEVLGKEAGVGWHAVIHRPENDNDPRNWHAHVVFTQCRLERDPESPGRWMFERDGKMLKQTEVIRAINGNGPGKNKGAKALMMAWRRRWAEMQNAELIAGGAQQALRLAQLQGARHRPRAGPAHGVGTGPRWTGKRGGRRRCTGARTHRSGRTWSAPGARSRRPAGSGRRSASEWPSTSRRCACARGSPSRGHGSGDPVYDAMAEALGGEEGHATEGALHEALEGALEGTRPGWRDEWEKVEQKGLGLEARGAEAARLVEAAGGSQAVGRYRRTPALKHFAGTLLEAAEGYEQERRRWQGAWQAVAETGDEDPEGDAKALAMAEAAALQPADLTAYLGEANARRVGERGRRHLRRRAAREAMEQVRDGFEKGSNPERIAEAGARLVEQHKRYWEEDAPVEGKDVNEFVIACQDAARLRKEFLRACAKRPKQGENPFAQFVAMLGTDSPRMVAARERLGEAEHALMRRAAREGVEVKKRVAGVERRGKEMMARIHPEGTERPADPAAVREALADEGLCSELAEGAPSRLAYLESLGRHLDVRERRLGEALEEWRGSGAGAAAAWAATQEAKLLEAMPGEEPGQVRKAGEAWLEQARRTGKECAGDDGEAADQKLVALSAGRGGEVLRHTDAMLWNQIQEAAGREDERTAHERKEAGDREKDLVARNAAQRKKGLVELRTMLLDPVRAGRLAPAERDRLRRRVEAIGGKLRARRAEPGMAA